MAALSRPPLVAVLAVAGLLLLAADVGAARRSLRQSPEGQIPVDRGPAAKPDPDPDPDSTTVHAGTDGQAQGPGGNRKVPGVRDWEELTWVVHADAEAAAAEAGGAGGAGAAKADGPQPLFVTSDELAVQHCDMQVADLS